MQAELEHLERTARDDDLAVEDAPGLRSVQHRSRDLGEVAFEERLPLGLEVDAAAHPMRDAAEAVVFRLELPALARRQLIDCLGLHRAQVQGERLMGHGRARLSSIVNGGVVPAFRHHRGFATVGAAGGWLRVRTSPLPLLRLPRPLTSREQHLAAAIDNTLPRHSGSFLASLRCEA